MWLYLAFLGACFGSFAGVIIYRLERGISIVWPRSFCGECHNQLKVWHNIPLISWFLLRGRCYFCKKNIGLRTIIIEIIFATALVALYARFGLSFALVERLLMFFLLVCLSYIDIDSFYLPTSLLVVLFCVGLGSSYVYTVNPDLYVPPSQQMGILKYMVINPGLHFSLMDRVLGAALGLVVLAGLNIVASWILRRSKRIAPNQWAMGFGDALLAMNLGLFIGLSHLVLMLFLASCLGSVVGLLLRLSKKSHSSNPDVPEGAIPFGPFLALSALYIYLF